LERLLPDIADHRFIVTGGPGSGKTSLLQALAGQGIACMPEAGRGIIRHQVAIGGGALPWNDPAAFAEQMLGWDMRSHDEAAGLPGPVMFDRGIPDVVGYLRLSNLPVPAHVAAAARLFRYNARVFIAPPWPEIFRQDAERKQTFAEAERTYHAMVRVYADYGYTLLELPRDSIAMRAAFVRSHLDC